MSKGTVLNDPTMDGIDVDLLAPAGGYDTSTGFSSNFLRIASNTMANYLCLFQTTDFPFPPQPVLIFSSEDEGDRISD
jgi:hypothetical protein